MAGRLKVAGVGKFAAREKEPVTLIRYGPSAEDADTALAFVFDTWAMLPQDGPADPADIALAAAFATWREAKGRQAR